MFIINNFYEIKKILLKKYTFLEEKKIKITEVHSPVVLDECGNDIFYVRVQYKKDVIHLWTNKEKIHNIEINSDNKIFIKEDLNDILSKLMLIKLYYWYMPKYNIKNDKMYLTFSIKKEFFLKKEYKNSIKDLLNKLFYYDLIDEDKYDEIYSLHYSINKYQINKDDIDSNYEDYLFEISLFNWKPNSIYFRISKILEFFNFYYFNKDFLNEDVNDIFYTINDNQDIFLQIQITKGNDLFWKLLDKGDKNGN